MEAVFYQINNDLFTISVIAETDFFVLLSPSTAERQTTAS